MPLEKTSQKTRNFQKFSKGRYFLLGCCSNVNFDLFWETKVQILKYIVWLQFKSYYNLNTKISLKLNGPSWHV